MRVNSGKNDMNGHCLITFSVNLWEKFLKKLHGDIDFNALNHKEYLKEYLNQKFFSSKKNLITFYIWKLYSMLTWISHIYLF